MTTVTSRVFRSGNSEAVRPPKDVAFAHSATLVTLNPDDFVDVPGLKLLGCHER